MNRQDAERIITEYLKPIFGFALKRCKSIQDAEDLTQEIVPLQSVPAHLKKVKEYELQSIFYSDGWFLVHCIQVLLKNGKLKEPTLGQRKALSTIIAYR